MSPEVFTERGTVTDGPRARLVADIGPTAPDKEGSTTVPADWRTHPGGGPKAVLGAPPGSRTGTRGPFAESEA